MKCILIINKKKQKTNPLKYIVIFFILLYVDVENCVMVAIVVQQSVTDAQVNVYISGNMIFILLYEVFDHIFMFV